MCDIDRNTDYFTERLLAEKEADLLRLAKINEALREVNARLAEENRKLKEGRHGTCPILFRCHADIKRGR